MPALSAQAINAGLRFSPLWVYGLGLLPLAWLVARAATGNLGADPVKTLERELGLLGLQFLVAVLAVTPLRNLTGISLVRFRRALGVLAFTCAALHFTVWLTLDLAFRWGEIWADIVKRPYITVGFAAFLMLVPLAVTSNNLSVRRLGAAAWKRLHWLTYPAAVLAAIHFLWLVKAWPLEPLLYLGAVAALLALRWRPLRRRVAA
jgi:methionine sulfoxide reductase heme-binding subunit